VKEQQQQQQQQPRSKLLLCSGCCLSYLLSSVLLLANLINLQHVTPSYLDIVFVVDRRQANANQPQPIPSSS